MDTQRKKDSAIAAGVTLLAALIILLLLFVGHMGYDREALARASMPEIQEDEVMYLEPELDLSAPGEENELPDEGDAPLPLGEPVPGPENEEIVTPGKSPEPKPSSEQPVASTKPSPVKATDNQMSDAEKKRLQSMNAKFSTTTNGSAEGKVAAVNGQGKVNTSGSLNGRKFLGCATSKMEITNPQQVVIQVVVAADGHVKKATALSGAEPYRSQCRIWAQNARWSAKEGAPDATGTITFTIK